MKADALGGLTNAGWPVFLVDRTATILVANPAAVAVFGPAAQMGASLAAIWLTDNDAMAAEFLARAVRNSSAMTTVRLLGPGGDPLAFRASVCSTIDMDRRYLLQLLPRQSAASAPAPATVPEAPVAAGVRVPAPVPAFLAPPAPVPVPAAPAPAPASTGASDAAFLVQKQKLDVALQLARTVSLDFNNVLTTILGHTSLILSKMEANNPWRTSLIEVEKSAARAAEIANDLGAFSRPDKEAKAQQSGNLNHLLQRNVETFQSTKLEKEVAWSLVLERKLYAAKFDESKMQQALLKIMENALEALAPRGRITLTTKNIDLTQAAQDRNAQLAAGSYVCAEIADDGAGIEPDVLPRIFEPFFTTKRGNKHRGLGLAWVYGIVTNHGGGVAVSSQPGAGTSVRVYLPADKKFIKEEAPAIAELNGTGTILMVDDEDLLLTMGETVLTAYGYKVLTANNGQKALDIIGRANPPIDLIITDLVMPNMSGRELVERVRQLSPGIRILSSSGYVRSSDEQDNTAYLQKPFTSQDLLFKVKQALAADGTSGVD
jgi:signal transduction histidine kinase/CheY-like chemotaxis protein